MNGTLNDFPWQLFPGWINSDNSIFWLEKTYQELSWEQPLVRVYGRKYPVPRKSIFLGEAGIKYRYSGVTHMAKGWPLWFYPLLEKVVSKVGQNFNGCLVNLYRNGNDHMGWHADDEPEIDQTRPIASLSFGEKREFVFKQRGGSIRKVITLNNGDLLVMNPGCQDSWLHSVPTRKRISKSRINLTFRCYI